MSDSGSRPSGSDRTSRSHGAVENKRQKTTIIKDHKFEVRHGRNQYHLIPYIGNKSGFAHIFDRMIPDLTRRRFYDVFGGGASFSIYCSSRFGSKRVTYNDNNPTIVNFIRYVKEDPKGLHGQYMKHREKSDGQYYLDVRDKSLDDGLTGAGRFLYLAKNAFSGKIRFNGSNKFNAPMRKNNRCPDLKLDRLAEISNTIKDITITNEPYEHYGTVRDSFVYLDPPYMGNPNSHYNGVPETDEFIRFVKSIEGKNQVMISEQNDPADLRLSGIFSAYQILLRRSLQYNTQNDSKEIIAINYALPKKTSRSAA